MVLEKSARERDYDNDCYSRARKLTRTAKSYVSLNVFLYSDNKELSLYIRKIPANFSHFLTIDKPKRTLNAFLPKSTPALHVHFL